MSLKKCWFVAPETKCWRDFSVRLVSTFCIVDREKRPRFGSLLDKSCTSCNYSALHSWDQLFVPCSPLELRYTASEFEGFCSSFNRFLRERASFEHHGCSWTMSVGGFLTFGPVRTDYLTHTWWGGVCGVMQSRGTKRLKFRRALRLIRDTTVRSLTWKRRVFVLKPRVKLKHLRHPNVLFISLLYFNLPFQFSFLSHRFGHYSSHSKDFFDIVSSFVGFSIKMCCFHSVDLMADSQEAVFPSQSFLWAVPSMFLDQRHTKLIR